MRLAGVIALSVLLTAVGGLCSATAEPGQSVAAKRAAATRALNLASPAYRTAQSPAANLSEAVSAPGAAAVVALVQKSSPVTSTDPRALQASLMPAPETGRWYLFAAVRNRSYGVSFLADDYGEPYRAWTVERVAVIADGQIGFGWRRGAHQTSLGYLVRRQRYRDPFLDQIAPHVDQVVALTYSFSPEPAARKGRSLPKTAE